MTLTIVPDRAAVVPCKSGLDPDIWFPRPADKRATRVAAELCAVCPIREACLAEALSRNIEFGIWGGLTPNQRRQLSGRQHPCRRCQTPCELRSPYCGEACRKAARKATISAYDRRRAYRRAA